MADKYESMLVKHAQIKMQAWLTRYNILINGKWQETGLCGWKTALAHARKYAQDLFNQNIIIEILNLNTGEIFTLDEAEKRAAEYARKRYKAAVIGGTT